MAKKKKEEKKAKVAVINSVFATKDANFLKAVQEAKDAGFKVDPTTRQASKFRNRKGIVYLYKSGMVKAVNG